MCVCVCVYVYIYIYHLFIYFRYNFIDLHKLTQFYHKMVTHQSKWIFFWLDVIFCFIITINIILSPWRTLWWNRNQESRRRFLSVWRGLLRSRWATPFSPRWGKRPGLPCRRKWWWEWRTTKRLRLYDQTETWETHRDTV